VDSWGTESDSSLCMNTNRASGVMAWLLWMPRATLLKTSSTTCTVWAVGTLSSFCGGRKWNSPKGNCQIKQKT